MTYKKRKIGFSSSDNNDIEAENFEQCIVCDKDTGGALFCCLEHSEEYNNNPAKYKKKLKKQTEVIEVANPSNDDNDDSESTIFGHTVEWFGRQDQRHIQQIPASGRALILKEREVYVLGPTTIFHICPVSIPQLTTIEDRIDEEEKKDVAIFQPFVPAP